MLIAGVAYVWAVLQRAGDDKNVKESIGRLQSDSQAIMQRLDEYHNDLLRVRPLAGGSKPNAKNSQDRSR